MLAMQVMQRRRDLGTNCSHLGERQRQIVKSRLERIPGDQFEDQVSDVEIAA
jgi:hypothetical protein